MKPARAPMATRWLLFGLAALAVAGTRAAPAGDAEVAIGRLIYTEGRLADGSPLRATRLGVEVKGSAAACEQCHRRSGLGVVEGDQAIAPITGRALFGGVDGRVVTVMDPVRGKALSQSHEPFSESMVAGAIRAGLHPSGRAMNELMPRYALDERSMHALLAYLRTLSSEWSPGVDAQNIRFATVITPGVDPQRRTAFLQTLTTALLQKNGSTLPGKRHMVMAAEFAMMTERHWDLDIWELKGAPETWGEQLQAFYRRSPVFAILSGLSEQDWTPVHRFCESEGVPCWFPSLSVAPRQAAQGRYSLYFSEGTRLEAEVLAARLRASKSAAGTQRVLQLQGAGAAAMAAADDLAASLAGSGISVQTVAVADGGRAADVLAAAAARGDAVAGWMAPTELEALAAAVPQRAEIYLSATLAAPDRATVPEPWRSRSHFIYPWQLPSQRGSNLAYFRAWVNQRRIALVDEPMQSDVYFAVNYLRDTLGDMLNNLYRDYLVERAENMLSLRESRKAIDETLERQIIRQRYVHVIESGHTGGSVADAKATSGRAVITPAENLGLRTGTTAYPPLGLGPGQRLASKGAYIARFDGPNLRDLVAESPWIVP